MLSVAYKTCENSIRKFKLTDSIQFALSKGRIESKKGRIAIKKGELEEIESKRPFERANWKSGQTKKSELEEI